MKQLFRLSILVLALLLSATATAYDFEVDGIYYDIEGTNASVTFGNNEYTGSVTIPATVTYNGTTYPVTAIGLLAFRYCTGLTGIDIPNSVTEIGNYAFEGCTGLTGIDIPNSVTFIGFNAFYNTGWYNNQPDGLVYAGNVAYHYKGAMPSGTRLTLKEGTLGIASAAFSYCTGLTSIYIPNSVIEIADEAFEGCMGLTSINIPNSVTEIGENAFYDTGWYNNQPDGLVYAGRVAYEYKGTMPSGTSITLRDGTTSITGSAFRYCTGLTSIVIPNSVTEIGSRAFAHCTDLTSVNIPNSVTVIRGGTFFRCTGLTSIVIPNSVTSIGNESFCNCRGLTSIVIPNSVTEIAKDAFSYCTGLTSIVVESGNPRYDSHNDCNAIIETASNTLIVGCENTIIPNTVTKIGDYAFDGRTGLTDIDIPNSVTAIGFSAFADCTGLTSIDIPNSVTKIGNSAFYRCTGLTSIDIPNSVTSIGLEAFCSCTGLTSIVIPNSVTEIGQWAFGGCTGLSSIIIPNSVTEIDYQAFADCTELSDVYCYIADPLRVSNGYDDPCYWWYLYDGDYSGRTLHVLQGMTGAYQADERWYPYFGQIVDDLKPDVPGDVNGDLEVNIADVNAVINVILGGVNIPRADVNNDGEVNIADVNAVIDIILDPVVVEEHEWVDLGLPSGTLWATCNIGANSPEEYGDYFAWGETAPKDDYNLSNYKWCNGSATTFTKYCTKSSFGYNGFVDNKTELDPEDDAAYVNWGSSWRMPTTEQMQELIDNCSSVWTTQNGVNGRLFTGPNGNTTFWPAAGGRSGASFSDVGSVGSYWSRILFSIGPYSAYYLYFDSGNVRGGSIYRYCGFAVRAVRVP